MNIFEQTHFSDPATLTAAVVAITLVGLSKGGLGGALALMGVPILALFMSPVQAAAILLPVLIIMDCVSLWTWRGKWDAPTLRLMLPAGVAGIAVGWMAVSITSEAAVRLIVGIVALLFVLRSVMPVHPDLKRYGAPQRPLLAWLWGTIAGFTSFVAHAGGPPFQVYTIPLRLDPKIFTGTAVIFFAVMNAIKVAPYMALGQFDQRTLASAAFMIPVAAASTLAGAAIVKRMRAEVFYPLMYVMIAVVSVKLIWDGLVGLM